jgi:hypothetical protein
VNSAAATTVRKRRAFRIPRADYPVQRLRLASVEDIAAVPGFGGKAAGELKTFLDARSGELLEQAGDSNSEVPLP